MNAPEPKTYTLTDEDLSLLYPILRTQSKSRNQGEMSAHVYSELSLLGATVEYDEQSGNIYATKGEAPLYPCFVAHLDTVHAIIKNYDIRQYKNGDLIGWNVDTNQISGIGGDDKCGIFLALAMLRDLPAAKVAFFTDEEIGCLGAYDARMPFFDDVAFVLEADRRGNSDIIRDAAGTELYSHEFSHAIAATMAEHGFSEAPGSITDVLTLKENGLAVSCLNMSAGYHNAHSAQEIVRPADLARALSFARGITNAASGQQWPTPTPARACHLSNGGARPRARATPPSDMAPRTATERVQRVTTP
jgi:putative aminopeptidase FrvX